MPAKMEKHIHKLKRVRFKSGNSFYFCALPDCSFKVNPALALGKRSICWRCGESFIINEYALRLAKPHCDKCHMPKHYDDGLPPATTEQLNKEEAKATSSLSDRLTNIIKDNPTKTIAAEGDEDI